MVVISFVFLNAIGRHRDFLSVCNFKVEPACYCIILMTTTSGTAKVSHQLTQPRTPYIVHRETSFWKRSLYNTYMRDTIQLQTQTDHYLFNDVDCNISVIVIFGNKMIVFGFDAIAAKIVISIVIVVLVG